MVQEIEVRHGAVTGHSPIGSPGIADDESLLAVVVADCANGVPAEHRFTGAWHRHNAGSRDLLALKALVGGEAEDEGVAAG